MAMGPAGSVHMTLRDWGKYVSLHLRGDPRNPRHEAKLLNGDTFARLHTPSPDQSYVCGWVCENRSAAKGDRPADNGAVIWHNGSNTMWYAYMILAPETDCAVLLAVNCFDSATQRVCGESAGALLRAYAHSKPVKQ
jgi:CubicO group peptidase (beta-lactamase class C family)